MLADGQNTLSTAPWLFYLPASMVVLLTVAMALIGDGLRDALDPTSQSGGRAMISALSRPRLTPSSLCCPSAT